MPTRKAAPEMQKVLSVPARAPRRTTAGRTSAARPRDLEVLAVMVLVRDARGRIGSMSVDPRKYDFVIWADPSVKNAIRDVLPDSAHPPEKYPPVRWLRTARAPQPICVHDNWCNMICP
jgi:hypothetical protein